MALHDTHEGLFMVGTGYNTAIESQLPPVLHQIEGTAVVDELVDKTHHTMEVIAQEVGKTLLTDADY